MLTENQVQFLAKIPDDAIVEVKPWDVLSAEYAHKLVKNLESTGLEVFWEGSLALGIPGENDIDLYIFSSPNDFNRSLPGIIPFLGQPTYTLTEKILWRVNQDGHKIDASLADKSSQDVVMDMLFFNSLKQDPGY